MSTSHTGRFLRGSDNKNPVRCFSAVIASLLAATLALGADPIARQSQWINDYAVVWSSPSVDAKGSMPLGNGDIGLNVWVEKDGDLWFYISKSDSWGDNPTYYWGLPKVGRLRVRFAPNPFSGDQPFVQKLDLAKGRIEITAGKPGSEVSIHLWVDAHRPVVRLESRSDAPFTLEADFESNRTDKTKVLDKDILIPGLKNEIAWCYKNRNQLKQAELQDLIFGGWMRGERLIRKGETALVSNAAGKEFVLSVDVLTRQPVTQEQWVEAIRAQSAANDEANLSLLRQEHEQWWHDYWDRSWIRLSGDDTARYVTQACILQRFKNACAGRGNWPIQPFGSLFTVDQDVRKPVGDPKEKKFEVEHRSADFRLWGPKFWMQNTRHVYWPMLQSGDFDLMQSFFRFFRRVVEVNRNQVKELYGFDGAFFQESTPMQGGIPSGKDAMTPEKKPHFTSHHINGILEFSAMALDYYRMTQDEVFAREVLVPSADAGLTFFANYFPRDAQGMLLLEPDNALEAYWKVRNPTPDVAGLRWVTSGLLELPPALASPEMRKRWEELRRIVPPIPLGLRDGRETILPHEGCKEIKDGFEEPQLYAVFPFRHYGVGKPDVERALATYHTRKVRLVGCWHQDSLFAAHLGLTTNAREGVAAIFHPEQKSPVFVFRGGRQLDGRDNGFRFPAFWGKGHCWVPCEEQGGLGMNTLQAMLMQCDGRKILLTPAWPKEWNAEFKLHAPERTTVEGRIVEGKVVDLKVTPEQRARDVVVCPEVTRQNP